MNVRVAVLCYSAEVRSWNHDGMACKPEICGVWSRGEAWGPDLACDAQMHLWACLCHQTTASVKASPLVTSVRVGAGAVSAHGTYAE